MPEHDPDHQSTDYLLGELNALDELDFQAALRGNSDMRRDVQEQSDFAHELERELRMTPGGLDDHQRDHVLDELEAVLAERSEENQAAGGIRKIVFGRRSGARPKVRQAFFSPTARALNAISVAAAVIAVVVTGYNMKVVKGFGSEDSQADGSTYADDVVEQGSGAADVSPSPTVVAFADKIDTWDIPGFFGDDEELYEAVLAELEDEQQLSEEELGSGFRLVREQSRSTVPVVANSDFYETLWTKVRRESELPHRESVAVEELVNYFPYAYPKPSFGEAVGLTVEAGVCPWNLEHALVRIGIRAQDGMDGSEKVMVKDLGVIADFNPAVVRGYRLLGYAQCVQDPVEGNQLKSSGKVGTQLLGGQTVTAIYEVILHGSSEWADTPVLKGEKSLREAGNPYPVGLHAGLFARAEGKISDDLLNVRVVYRQPGSLRYLRRSASLSSQPSDWAAMDDDFRFATAVSAFGMLLKGELDESEMDFDTVGELASSAIGDDADGRRAEFLALVKHVRVLEPAYATVEEREHVYASGLYGSAPPKEGPLMFEDVGATPIEE